MVTKIKKKKRRRRSTPLKILEARGLEILKEKEPIIDAGPSLYLVPSMSAESYHDVRHLAGAWSCDCAYHTAGRMCCKHICAARLVLLMRERTLKAIRGTRIEAPKARCPGCKKSNFHESIRYDALREKVPVYVCDEPDCKHRFTWRPGFKKRWYSDDTITDVLIDAGAGHPPHRIAERMAKGGDGPDERTIRRWIDKYAKIMEEFASTLPYRAGDRWSLDEKRLKTHPNGSKKKHWWVAVLDEVTGLILGYEVSDTKSGYDATNLLNEIIARVGRVPDVTVSDKLNGYKKGFKNAIKSKNPSAVLVADAGINGKHVNNNMRERRPCPKKQQL